MTIKALATAVRGCTTEQRKPSAAKIALGEIVIGKDVLELLSSAMYVDPMTIYREYVQNAADAIDDAKQQGVLGTDECGRVDISVDPSTRSVRIRDNGSGIEKAKFVRKLTALGASAKRGTAARGFRGVGRLAGLGYAQELIFRSRTFGESLVSELRWDCRQLKGALRSAEADRGVAELIRSIVTVQLVDPGGYPDRFFEVELRGIIRLRSDRLMSPMAIAEYLSQVAPVPFAPAFKFGADITATLASLVNLGNLDIRIEGLDTPLYRPYCNGFADEKHIIPFDGVDIIEVPSVDGGIAAVAWILHHDYEGAIPTGTLIKGVRFRSGNVQVGDNTLLEELFPEPRFNGWSVGEVHVIDRRVVPNGRRDHFEQNAHFHNLLNHLTPTARDIARRCRTSSIRRKWLREFELHRTVVSEKLDVINQRTLSPNARKALIVSAEPALQHLDKIAGMDLLIDDRPEDLRTVVAGLRAEIANAARKEAPDASPLSHLPTKQRAMYEHLFGLVYECSANRVAAKALVDRILEKLRTDGPQLPEVGRVSKREPRRK